MSPGSKPENARERAEAIIDILLKHDYVRVTDLATQLAVTEATIRKDLTALETRGLLRRTHGGALHVRELTHEIARFYDTREVKHITEKQRIGRAAAERIQNGEIIALSGGSTPLQIARHIPDDRTFTAITNDISIARTLSDHGKIDIFVPGGYLRLGRDNLIGHHALEAIKDFEIDRVFLTVTGLDLEVGATAGHISNVVYLRELVARSQECVIVADHSKFLNPPQIVICDWDDIDVLITDHALPLAVQEKVTGKGIELTIA